MCVRGGDLRLCSSALDVASSLPSPPVSGPVNQLDRLSLIKSLCMIANASVCKTSYLPGVCIVCVCVCVTDLICHLLWSHDGP